MRTFGDVIAQARKKANLTQRQLAARIKTEEGRQFRGRTSTTLSTICAIRRAVIFSNNLPRNSTSTLTCCISWPNNCLSTLTRARFRKNRQLQPIGPSGANFNRKGRRSDDYLDSRPEPAVSAGARIFFRKGWIIRCEQIVERFNGKLYGQSSPGLRTGTLIKLIKNTPTSICTRT